MSGLCVMTQTPVPIYTDINNCKLAAVSWVIPDKTWSDHGSENDRSGPDYVANIANGIGWSTHTDTIAVATPETSSAYGLRTGIAVVEVIRGSFSRPVLLTREPSASALLRQTESAVESWQCRSEDITERKNRRFTH